MVIDENDGSLEVEFNSAGHGCLHMDLVMHGGEVVSFPCWGLGETGTLRIATAPDASVRIGQRAGRK